MTKPRKNWGRYLARLLVFVLTLGAADWASGAYRNVRVEFCNMTPAGENLGITPANPGNAAYCAFSGADGHTYDAWCPFGFTEHFFTVINDTDTTISVYHDVAGWTTVPIAPTDDTILVTTNANNTYQKAMCYSSGGAGGSTSDPLTGHILAALIVILCLSAVSLALKFARP
jgi:hypothetical protein